jgi:hypothetical protein
MSNDSTGRLVLRRQALADGLSDDELGRLTRRREWRRLRRGAYVDGTIPVEVAARHQMLVQATLSGLRRPAVVSHQSAAVLQGLRLWGVPLSRVHVTRRPPAWNDSGTTLVTHVGRIRDGDIEVVGGVPVTSAARTAVDLARGQPFEVAVVVLDAALRDRLVDSVGLREALAAIEGAPGTRSAARAVGFADGRSESVGESRSRVLLHRLGLAPSTLQLEVRAAGGRLVGRADFGWEEQRIVGEFDGRVKYGRLLRPGQDPGDVVFDEKLREDEIRDEGWGVVRWTWGDLAVPGRVGDRVGRALARGARAC